MRYLVTFKPLTYFFFGSDRTFSEDYVAKSSYFPQNTQLLGAMRRLLAESNGLLKTHGNGRYPDDPKAYRRLVGSATTENFESNDDLGAIEYLSSMFIVKEDLADALFRIPFDLEVGDDEVRRYRLQEIDGLYTFIDYDVKHISNAFFGGRAFWEAYLGGEDIERKGLEPFDWDGERRSGIFVSHSQVGIGLDRKRVIEKMFYRKEDLTLAESYRFACVLELNDDTMNEIEAKMPQKGAIQIGAEGSMFAFEAYSIEEKPLASHPIVKRLGQREEPGDTYLSLSETLVAHTDDFESDFALIPYEESMATIVAPKGRYRGRTTIKRIVPKGSVLYYRQPRDNAVVSAPGAYAKMGYNQAITYNKKEKRDVYIIPQEIRQNKKC